MGNHYFMYMLMELTFFISKECYMDQIIQQRSRIVYNGGCRSRSVSNKGFCPTSLSISLSIALSLSHTLSLSLSLSLNMNVGYYQVCIDQMSFDLRNTVKLVLSGHSKRRQNWFSKLVLLNAGQKCCRMLQEHSAMRLTFNKLPFVFKMFVLSFF